MPVELKIPAVGESVTEVEIGEWLKSEGEYVAQDDPVVVIETEKATVEVPAPVSGTITKILKQTGERARVGELVGHMEEGGKAREISEPEHGQDAGAEPSGQGSGAESRGVKEQERRAGKESPVREAPRVMPAARRLLEERGLEAGEVEATGPGGRLLKEDVLRHGAGRREEVQRDAGEQAAPVPAAPVPAARAERAEEVVPMTFVRRRIAERLVQSQQTGAHLTTFNEIDMSAVNRLRQEQRERFAEKYQVRLGFMSFFVKAAIDALKQVPQVNAEIRGSDIVYRNYYDICVAVGGGKGLVVPVLRHAELMSFAEIERAIADFARRAEENRLKPDELEGGTFTISNGGIYGSLLSTPIINPPQSGILGMHALQERPVVREGEVVVRPMMYVALTYDHRLVDGREAVTFLRRVKECIETPSRMLLEV